MKYVISM